MSDDYHSYYSYRDTNIDLSQSHLREHQGKFVVLHGRCRGGHSAARGRAQHLWARRRLAEQGIDVCEYGSYHVTVGTNSTTVYFGRH